MRLTFGATALLLGIVFSFLDPTTAQAQVVTQGPDSVRVPLPDTVRREGFFLSQWERPAKAALLSTVVPGLGQAYNKAYWKLPIIYATGAVLGYYLIDNNNKYQDFRSALIQRNIDSTDRYVNSPIYGIPKPGNGVSTTRGTENLRYSRDFYRRNRDLTILLSVLAYGLNIAEAYVHAHLREFDISDDLALRVQPHFIPALGTPTTSFTPGITLVLHPKSK